MLPNERSKVTSAPHGPTLCVAKFGMNPAEVERFRSDVDQSRPGFGQIWAISTGVGPIWARFGQHAQNAHGSFSGTTILDKLPVCVLCITKFGRANRPRRRRPRSARRRRRRHRCAHRRLCRGRFAHCRRRPCDASTTLGWPIVIIEKRNVMDESSVAGLIFSQPEFSAIGRIGPSSGRATECAGWCFKHLAAPTACRTSSRSAGDGGCVAFPAPMDLHRSWRSRAGTDGPDSAHPRAWAGFGGQLPQEVDRRSRRGPSFAPQLAMRARNSTSMGATVADVRKDADVGGPETVRGTKFRNNTSPFRSDIPDDGLLRSPLGAPHVRATFPSWTSSFEH